MNKRPQQQAKSLLPAPQEVTNNHLTWDRKQNEADPQQNKKGPHRALLIDELLRGILVFVAVPEFPVVNSKYAKYAKRTFTGENASWRSARLVCKRWNNILSPLIFRQWHFNNSWTTRLTTQPSRAKQLWCRLFPHDGHQWAEDAALYSQRYTQWKALVNFLCEYCSTPQQAPLAIRELCLTGKIDIATHLTPMLEIQALGRALTLLELRSEDIRLSLSIQDIFQARNEGHVSLPHLKHLILQKVTLLSVPEFWDPGYKYSLTSLYLNECRVTRTTVFAIVNALASPRLERLHLTDLREHQESQIGWVVPVVMAADDAMRLAGMYPDLILFEIQLPENHSATSTALAIRDMLPKVESFIFEQWTESVSYNRHYPRAQATPVHFCLDRHMTRLDISGSDDRCLLNQSVLDQFLRSSEARHLRELIVSTAKYDVAPPFVEGQAVSYWACEDLQLLDMDLKCREKVCSLSALRQIYSFIVVNCPRVRKLRIMHPLLRTELMSGLCLTSRLTELENLTLCSGFFSHWGAPGDKDLYNRKKYDAPRWVVAQPTMMDKIRKVSSLQMCRKVALTDSESWSWMWSSRGQQMLWPTVAESSPTATAKANHGQDGGLTKKSIRQQKQSSTLAIEEGSCWTKLQTIRVECRSEKFEIAQALGNRLQALLPGVRVDMIVKIKRF
ncbi:hypothetical protein BGW42_007119 [Actinomortierella wolfii]|nr:hypothetical protein BGW42_007119 [Actinomortierella wolfii]